MTEFPINKQEVKWLNRFDSLIKENIAKNSLNNDHLAITLNISPRTLYRIVLKYTGLSPNHYIRNIRLDQAYKLLETGHYLTSKEIAGKVGFKKVEYFTKLFKAKFELSPLEVLKINGFK